MNNNNNHKIIIIKINKNKNKKSKKYIQKLLLKWLYNPLCSRLYNLVVQPAARVFTRCSQLYNCLYSRLYNRLHRVYAA